MATRSNKKNSMDLSAYTEEGIRMLKVVCFAMEWHLDDDPITDEKLQELISNHTGARHGCDLDNEPERWNNAAGFIYSYWGTGGQVSPYAEGYDFSEIVSEQAGADHDEGFDFNVYDRNGQQRELETTIVSVLRGLVPYGNDEGYDEWSAGAPKRAAAKAKKNKATQARKDKKAADKKAAIDSLTGKQRKALGL